MIPAPESIRSILATDCGSTTTKAILIERGAEGYRLVTRGEAPTTVEAPFEDVTRGVLNAVREVEELRGRKLLDGDRILTPQQGDDGVDLYLSTSSAGGGLQMMVSGLVLQMTGESAQRAYTRRSSSSAERSVTPWRPSASVAARRWICSIVIQGSAPALTRSWIGRGSQSASTASQATERPRARPSSTSAASTGVRQSTTVP